MIHDLVWAWGRSGTAPRTGTTSPCRRTHAADRRLHLPRGKVLGGSHSLNAMIWVRGAREDYDGWAAAGQPGLGLG